MQTGSTGLEGSTEGIERFWILFKNCIVTYLNVGKVFEGTAKNVVGTEDDLRKKELERRGR